MHSLLRNAGEVGQSVRDSRILQEVREQTVVDKSNRGNRVADGLLHKVRRLQVLPNRSERGVERRQLVCPLGLFPCVF